MDERNEEEGEGHLHRGSFKLFPITFPSSLPISLLLLLLLLLRLELMNIIQHYSIKLITINNRSNYCYIYANIM